MAAGFDDIEVVPFSTSFHFETGTQNLDVQQLQNVTEMEGHLLLDFDDVLDRHRIAHMVYSELGLLAYAYHDGSSHVAASVELSASPSITAANLAIDSEHEAADETTIENGNLDDLEVFTRSDETLDLPMRPVAAASGARESDETNGIGATMAPGIDVTYGPVPGTWDFDRRDELYLNGDFQQDGGDSRSGYVQVSGILAFGVEDT